MQLHPLSTLLVVSLLSWKVTRVHGKQGSAPRSERKHINVPPLQLQELETTTPTPSTQQVEVDPQVDELSSKTTYDEYHIDDEYHGDDYGDYYDDYNDTAPSWGGPNCTACKLREEEKRLRIEQIKNDILRKLNFQSPPNVTRRAISKVPSISRIMDSYGMQGDTPFSPPTDDIYYEQEIPSGKLDRIYANAKEPPTELGIDPSDSFYLELPEAARFNKVQKAKLWIYVKPPDPWNLIIKMELCLVRPPGPGETSTECSLVGYKKIFPDPVARWHHFDVKSIVHQWAKRDAHHRYALIVTARGQEGRSPIVVPPAEGDYEGFEPVLELKLQDKHRRNKRSVPLVCSDSSQESRCCRYSLRVSFIDFGWDWVIAPPEYDANYCHGDCRFTYQDESPHSYISQQAEPKSGPCCSPTEHSSISLLYFNQDETIAFTNLPKMRVNQCGCA